jgi:hypothetical protein
MKTIDYKVEGNMFFKDKGMLTWGPFYYHSLDKAKEKTNEVLKNIVEWCNLKNPSLNIEPQNLKCLANGKQIIFDIQAWKDDTHIETCGTIITVEEIFFED